MNTQGRREDTFHSNRGIFDIFINISYEKKHSSFQLCETREGQLCHQYFSIKISFCVYLGSTTKLNRKEKALTNTSAAVSPLPSGDYLLEEFSWLL